MLDVFCLQQALTERQQLQDQNYQLQNKLAEHFRKKKADERQDVDKNVTDQEQRYLKYMGALFICINVSPTKSRIIVMIF